MTAESRRGEADRPGKLPIGKPGRQTDRERISALSSETSAVDGDAAATTASATGSHPRAPASRPAAKWDSLRAPLRYKRRTPGEQAADALHAHTALKRAKPADLSDSCYLMYLKVLSARMSDTAASLAEVAAAMSPPMTKEAFAGQLRRAHAASGVAITRSELGAQKGCSAIKE